jgi:beta-mannosidase
MKIAPLLLFPCRFMTATYLSSNWRVKAAPAVDFPRPQIQEIEWMPASVPGHVHCDLVANDVIPDPFMDRYEAGCKWIDETDWIYETDFEWHPADGLGHQVLRFEGLDTVCQVFLNDVPIAKHDNMFVPLEVEVTGRLIDGLNTLRVLFTSAVSEGIARRRAFFEKEGVAWDTPMFDERAFIRKAGYMSGWDWGPRLVSSGIWKPVQLLDFSSRITSFTVHTEKVGEGRFRLWTETVVQGDEQAVVSFQDQTVTGELDVIVDDPDLWWPNGYGSQTLHSVSASLPSGQRIEKKVGFRTIELLREKDTFGESFAFVVNGKRIWVRGANWIPNDSFPSRMTDGDYAEQVRICSELNMNMLRVWGGGLYETEAFYDACDRHGLLVWQDFPYACSYYPDDEAACEVAAGEARYQVLRLRDRTCLAIWCGNNENLAMWEQKWGGAEKAPARYFGENIYNRALPAVVAELDPKRPYVVSSPTGSTAGDTLSNDGGFGDQHFWEVWHGKGDWKFYADSKSRFASEFGFASSCSMAQWDKTLTKPTDWRFDSLPVRWHDKTGKPFDVFLGFVEEHYPKVLDMNDWVYYSQLNQRDALRFGIEHYRRSGFCEGTLIWQFNDCWPVQSWAVQDGLRNLKPSGFELGRLYAPVTLSLSAERERLKAVLVADTLAEQSYTVELTAFSTVTGEKLDTRRIETRCGSGTRSVALDTDLQATGDVAVRGRILEVAESDTWHLLKEPKNLKLGSPEYRVSWQDALYLEVKGIAIDLMVWDADNLQNVPLHDCTIKGVQATTVVNETLRVSFADRPRRIVVRSLSGEAEISLDPSNGKLDKISHAALVQEIAQ